MANPEHLRILQQGVEVWNTWRHQIGEEQPYLSPDLRRADLSHANLRGVDLSRATFSRATLSRADLRRADLRWANLYGADLKVAKLGETNPYEANLYEANLELAKLGGANLYGVNLYGANLHVADLRGTDLRGADLRETMLIHTDLTKANLSRVLLGETRFIDANLIAVRGLETCVHRGPSTLDHRTLVKSWPLHLAFLRGCGLPDVLIDYLPSLLAEPIQYDSLFISYASRDQAFAERLYADLQNKGVRCWYAPEDMKIGDEFRTRIDTSIHLHDRLLLILSEHSLKSRWVQREVETAFEKEEKEHRLVLFPLRLDDAVMEMTVGWAADIRRQRHIGDFTQWKEHDAYQQAFARLLRDLKAESGPLHG
jgi:uncharacterized protein YjbI with pentapeptide repeats